MRILLVILLVITGICAPLQAAMNARLNKAAGSPALASGIYFLVGSLVMLMVWLSGMVGRGRLSGFGEAPWWAWGAGLSGAFTVTIALAALPRTSAGVVIAAGLLGQALASIIIDNYGWLDLPRVPLSASRLIGLLLLLAGLILVQRK